MKEALVMGILFFFTGAAALLWILYLKQKVQILKLKDSLKGAAEALAWILKFQDEEISAEARFEKSVEASKCALSRMGIPVKAVWKTEEAANGKN